MRNPQAREFALVRELAGELIVVDDEHDVAHRLAGEAARVWQACDGRSDHRAIAVATGVPETHVAEIVERLAALGLLDGAQSAKLQTRRSVLRMAVALGAGLPLVTSVILPTPAQAFDSKPVETSPTAKIAEEPAPVQGSSFTESSSTPAAKTVPVRHADQPTRHAPSGSIRVGAKRDVAQRKGAGTGSGTRAGTGVPVAQGGGATGRPLRGSLPFTGSRLVQIAATGAGMLAAGVGLRRSVPIDEVD